MTDRAELDSVLHTFFLIGTDELSDRVIDAALDQVDTTRQRRVLRMPQQVRMTPAMTRLAVAAVIGVIALGGALYLNLPTKPAVGSPTPTPGLSASSGPDTSSAPTAPALPARAGQFDDMCDFGLGSATVGWVSTKAALYRTEDTGTTWSEVQPAGWATATATANLFIDADTAYSFLSGAESKIAATHDGGRTWVETALGGNDAWPVFSFQTPSRGFLAFFGQLKTDKVRIFETADGGATWADPRTATTIWGAIMPDWCGGAAQGVHREQSAVIGQTHPWLGQALDGSIQLSRNAGLTWTERPIPKNGTGGARLWGDDAGRLVLVVEPQIAPPGKDKIYTSTDDGRSWQLAAELRPSRGIVQFLSATTWILLAGDGSSIASTVDGGATWSTVAGSLTFNIGSTSFGSPDVGWTVPLCGPYADPPTYSGCDPTGVKRVLLQTIDGGRTWAPLGG